MKLQLAAIMAVVIGTFLFANAYAVMPDTNELLGVSGKAKQNANMLTEFTAVIRSCTDEVTAMTFTHWSDCKVITENFNTMLSDFMSQNSVSLKAINPYAYLYGNGLPS
jgi:hypothetical protein